MPITGQPILAARSMILHIFSAITSPSEPPNTVKSWLNTHTGAAVDRAVAGDDGVAPGPLLVHVELVGPVPHEGVELLERAGVEQLLDPLAGGQLALGVLLRDRVLGGGVDAWKRSSSSWASFSSYVSGTFWLSSASGRMVPGC